MNNIPQKPAEQSGAGPVIGSVIVIVVVIAGGFYFWGNKIAKDKQSAEIQNQAMSVYPDMNTDEIDIDLNQLDIPEEDLNNFENEIQTL
ncbi:MAG: hypothetical protein HW401_174 [Parcubacteria group bacterium]|nr:hypothetical protein [Parcubacteria group bacterium]